MVLEAVTTNGFEQIRHDGEVWLALTQLSPDGCDVRKHIRLLVSFESTQFNCGLEFFERREHGSTFLFDRVRTLFRRRLNLRPKQIRLRVFNEFAHEGAFT